MSATEELERGQLAADVLKNRVYAESMAQIEAEITARWQVEPDPKAREWLWNMIQSHRRLQEVLKYAMETGQLRSKQIEREQTRLQRVRGALIGRHNNY